MRTLALTLLLIAVVGAASVAAPPKAADCSDALVAIFVFGDTRGWMGAGFLVGDGQWVVTMADVVTEKINAETKLTVKYATVLSPWTGESYRAEVKTVDMKKNLAVLRLPMKGLPAVPLAGADGFKKARAVTIGQIFSGEQVGNRWDTTIQALSREPNPKRPAALVVRKWTAQNAVLSETKGIDWLFLSKMDPADNAPRASMVLREDGTAVGMYNSRLEVGEGKKPASYGQSLPSTELIKTLATLGVDAAGLRKASAPTIEPDKHAKQGLQLIWATLTQTILGKWTEARKNATSLLDLRPESPTANLLMGVTLAGGGKTEEAVKHMDKAISLDPNVPGGYFTRGAALASLKKTKEAEADFRKAIEQTPDDVKPMIALADLIAADKARRTEAAEIARKAVKTSPQDPLARMTLALILKSAGSYDQAIAELKEVLKIAPRWGEAKAALAAIYEASGDVASAETQYRDLVKAEPENPDALFTLASFLADHEKKTEAKELVTKLLAMKLPKELETAAKELEKKL
ncbi:MAG: tetratricopeptide repeat protein [Armatimonadota bacterium]|nr:tetratricopeptide repeat protein [Armatimonadota bacterium]